MEVRDGHNWENWRDRLQRRSRGCSPGRSGWSTNNSRNALQGTRRMAHITRHIGLSLGADICWPICFEAILKRLELAIPWRRRHGRLRGERVTIEPFDLRQPVRYDLVIDRAHALVPHQPRVDQEGHRAERPLRVQQPVVDPGEREAHDLLRDDAARAAGPRHLDAAAEGLRADRRPAADAHALRALFDLGPIGAQLGYPLFMKPYDGGGWVGVSKVDDEAGLRAAYEESGTKLMHLQAAVIPYERFVRCIGLGPQTRVVNYDPAAPLHDRYRMDRDFLDAGAAGRARGHHADDQRVLRLGLQLLRGAAARRRLAPDRLRQRLPGLAGDVAALPLPVADQGEPALGDLLRRDATPRAPQPRLGAVLRDRRPRTCRTARSCAATRARAADARHRRASRSSATQHLGHLDAVADEFFGTEQARDAVRQKVAALFPAHEVDEFTELFYGRIQRWRAGGGRAADATRLTSAGTRIACPARRASCAGATGARRCCSSRPPAATARRSSARA